MKSGFGKIPKVATPKKSPRKSKVQDDPAPSSSGKKSKYSTRDAQGNRVPFVQEPDEVMDAQDF